MKKRFWSVALIAFSLHVQASVLSFHSGGTVYAGPLENKEAQQIQRLARLQRQGDADELRYAVDRSGRVTKL